MFSLEPGQCRCELGTAQTCLQRLRVHVEADAVGCGHVARDRNLSRSPRTLEVRGLLGQHGREPSACDDHVQELHQKAPRPAQRFVDCHDRADTALAQDPLNLFSGLSGESRPNNDRAPQRVRDCEVLLACGTDEVHA